MIHPENSNWYIILQQVFDISLQHHPISKPNLLFGTAK